MFYAAYLKIAQAFGKKLSYQQGLLLGERFSRQHLEKFINKNHAYLCPSLHGEFSSGEKYLAALIDLQEWASATYGPLFVNKIWNTCTYLIPERLLKNSNLLQAKPGTSVIVHADLSPIMRYSDDRCWDLTLRREIRIQLLMNYLAKVGGDRNIYNRSPAKSDEFTARDLEFYKEMVRRSGRHFLCDCAGFTNDQNWWRRKVIRLWTWSYVEFLDKLKVGKWGKDFYINPPGSTYMVSPMPGRISRKDRFKASFSSRVEVIEAYLRRDDEPILQDGVPPGSPV